MIIELKERKEFLENVKLNRVYVQFQKLLTELRKKELPHKIIEPVNQDIEDLNSTPLLGSELRKFVKQKHTKILKLLEKDKIVPKGYYLNQMITVFSAIITLLGLSVTMSVGGKIGVLIAAMGIFICIPIAVVLSFLMEKKASKEGRQLDVKYYL